MGEVVQFVKLKGHGANADSTAAMRPCPLLYATKNGLGRCAISATQTSATQHTVTVIANRIITETSARLNAWKKCAMVTDHATQKPVFAIAILVITRNSARNNATASASLVKQSKRRAAATVSAKMDFVCATTISLE